MSFGPDATYDELKAFATAQGKKIGEHVQTRLEVIRFLKKLVADGYGESGYPHYEKRNSVLAFIAKLEGRPEASGNSGGEQSQDQERKEPMT